MKRLNWMASLLAAVALLSLAACGSGEGTNDGGPGAPEEANGDTTPADETTGDEPIDVQATRSAMLAEAWEFLKQTYNRAPDPDDRAAVSDGWGPESTNVPYTGLVLQGLFGSEVWDPSDDMIRDSVTWLLETQETTGAWSFRPDVQQLKGVRAVYITSILAQLMVDLNVADGPWKGRLDNQIAAARDYIKQSQVGNPDGPAPEHGENDEGFGGWAYSREELEGDIDGAASKPASNMSTTTFAIDALQACGVSKDDPLWEDALTFLKRNQNAGEVQSEGFSAMHEGMEVKMAGEGSADYGGAIYSESTSKATGYTENEDGTVTLYSYGSMTYNLLRAYLFAGLDRDSTPVKLAWGWIQRNYTVERVPGFRDPAEYDMGLYYYYMSMSRTLDALDVDVVDEPDRGLEHNWREDLVRELNERQKGDGHWVNDNHGRWQENSPVLCTAYVLNTLRHTRE